MGLTKVGLGKVIKSCLHYTKRKKYLYVTEDAVAFLLHNPRDNINSKCLVFCVFYDLHKASAKKKFYVS